MMLRSLRRSLRRDRYCHHLSNRATLRREARFPIKVAAKSATMATSPAAPNWPVRGTFFNLTRNAVF